MTVTNWDIFLLLVLLTVKTLFFFFCFLFFIYQFFTTKSNYSSKSRGTWSKYEGVDLTFFPKKYSNGWWQWGPSKWICGAYFPSHRLEWHNSTKASWSVWLQSFEIIWSEWNSSRTAFCLWTNTRWKSLYKVRILNFTYPVVLLTHLSWSLYRLTALQQLHCSCFWSSRGTWKLCIA